MKRTPRVNPNQPSNLSFANRVGRAVWGLVHLLVFRWIPTPFHGLRRIILRLFGAKLSSSARVYSSARIWAPWNLVMGPNSCLGPGVICYNVDKVFLERNALVSQYVHLCGASHDHRHPKFPLIHAPIRIKAGAWVCADAFVGMGVTIGEEAVIGARSVVSKDMPAGMICSGFPCVPLKPRFPTPGNQ